MAEDQETQEPVYDARGNVRPHGTPGARPMTYAERVKIAQRLASGEVIETEQETPAEDDQVSEAVDQGLEKAKAATSRATAKRSK
jgi:hypothetical protein